MSEGSTGAAGGTSYRLIGLDTGDGRGERVILGILGNYSKPLLTPRGDRVIFSDRVRKKVNVVNFDGSGFRELAAGFGMSVWREGTGKEWVYYGIDENKDEHCPIIYRMPIDGGSAELVWDRTLVSVDGFQVSLDGKRASGNFPWPDGGVAVLPNGTFSRLSRGCWPGLAADRLTLFWIFDGAHRNLTLYDYRSYRHWKVNINGALGVDGYEVYHPKWGNDSRYMVITGPYREGSGSNRIMAGGNRVEIYLGRFNGSYTAIESWIPITNNDRGDFFPDVWIESGVKTSKRTQIERTETQTTEATIPSNKTQAKEAPSLWLGNPQGLVFVWQNHLRSIEIPSPRAGRPRRTATVEPRGRALYGRFFDMALREGAFVADSASNSALLHGCRQSHALTVEALVTASDLNQEGPARIATFSSGASSRNWTLGQVRDRLILRLRTSRTPENATPPEWDLGKIQTGAPQHWVVTYEPGKLKAYLDGKKVLSTDRLQGDFTTWSPQFLLFGDEWDGQRSWRGRLEHIALYSRIITAKEVAWKFAALKKSLSKRKPLNRLVVDARLSDPSVIPNPKDIAPYRRALLVQSYDVVKVVSGAFGGKRIMVARWVILDGQVLEEAKRTLGTVNRLTLERFDDHPELEGERMTMDSDEFKLPLFYEIVP